MEIEHAHVEAAASGAEVGIKVRERVREGRPGLQGNPLATLGFHADDPTGCPLDPCARTCQASPDRTRARTNPLASGQ